MRRLISIVIFLTINFTFSTIAIGANEQHGDFNNSIQENRYKELVSTLRDPVGINISIGDSNSSLAKDLREQVRKMIIKNNSNVEIRQFMVDRYGDFVVFKPAKAKTFKPAKTKIPILFYIGTIVSLVVFLIIVKFVFNKNTLLGVLSLLIFIIVGSGVVLEKISREFQFGMKTRYVDQCTKPLQAIQANVMLFQEKIVLYNISPEDMFLGVTKEQSEKLRPLPDAGYYWVYYNSCKSLKSKEIIHVFLEKAKLQ
jgi:cytochrome c-type biogenesis protein CcmH